MIMNTLNTSNLNTSNALFDKITNKTNILFLIFVFVIYLC